MDAWQRNTHLNTAFVLSSIGISLRTPERGGDCCGALHSHAGLSAEAKSLAERVMRSMPGYGADVAKNRNGKTGIATLAFRKACMRFEDYCFENCAM